MNTDQKPKMVSVTYFTGQNRPPTKRWRRRE